MRNLYTDPARRNLPRSARPPLITLSEFAHSLGLRPRQLPPRLGQTLPQFRPRPAMDPKESGHATTAAWYRRDELQRWHDLYESGAIKKKGKS